MPLFVLFGPLLHHHESLIGRVFTCDVDESWHECLQEAVTVIEEQTSVLQSSSSFVFGDVSEVESSGNLIRDVSNNSKANQNWNAFKAAREED